jgi:Mn-dependent DtxR family transcriptional regulator
MTPNQIIVLLDIHRGFDRAIHLATVNGDLVELCGRGLIRPSRSFEFELTEKGDRLVKRLLEQADLR